MKMTNTRYYTRQITMIWATRPRIMGRYRCHYLIAGPIAPKTTILAMAARMVDIAQTLFKRWTMELHHLPTANNISLFASSRPGSWERVVAELYYHIVRACAKPFCLLPWMIASWTCMYALSLFLVAFKRGLGIEFLRLKGLETVTHKHKNRPLE